MKIKEIFLTVCSLMACFTACTNEEAMNGPVVADGTISVSFSIDGILTKATEEAGSAEEYTVSKSTVALFDYVDNVPTNCIGFSNATPTPSGGNGNLYTVSGIDVKSVIGKPVYVLVIANSDNTYTKDMTYQQYMADIIQTESFVPSSLVKVGGTQHTFAAAASSRTVNVQLTQLPARVDVKFAFPNEAAGHSCTFNVTSYKIDKVNRSSQLILPEYGNNYTHNNALEEVGLSWTKQENESGISTFSFYTYEKATASNPVVLTITGELFDGTNTETKTYTLSLNPTSANGGVTNGLIHGHLYDVTGNIDLTTKQVTFAVQVKEWETVNVDAKIKDVHYLFVKEHLAYMSNVGYYEIEFASDLPADKVNVKARYPYYKKDGNVIQSDTASYTSKDDEFPNIVVDNKNKLIKITSSIPTNYFSKTITFDVTNGAGLTESVKIIQYPALYMEGEVSKGGDDSYLLDSSNPKENPNLFTVTTIAADAYKVGVHKNFDGTTMTDAESNELVSPKFIVSSRYAVVKANAHSWNTAVTRCKTYWETTDSKKTGSNATYPPGTWRLPTLAELELLYNIQNAGLLAGTLFYTGGTNSGYWSGRSGWFFYFYTGQPVDSKKLNSAISEGGGIRCVHDVY